MDLSNRSKGVLVLSHMFWNVIIPNADNLDLKSLCNLAEAMFPLIPLISKKLLSLDKGIERALEVTCETNNIKVFNWIYSHNLRLFTTDKGFEIALCNNNLGFAHIIMNTFKTTVNFDGVYPKSNDPKFSTKVLSYCCNIENKKIKKPDAQLEAGLFKSVCLSGSVDTLKWLRSIFRTITKDNVILPNIGNIFLKSWINGHLEMAKWLSNTYKITRNEALLIGAYMFSEVCSNGHLNVAKWLNEKYVIPRNIALDMDMETFRGACINGHLEVAKWLYETYNITREDVFIPRRMMFSASIMFPGQPITESVKEEDLPTKFPFNIVCANGHINVAEWLRKTFNVTREEALYGRSSAFVHACLSGQLDILKWLHENYVITKEDALRDNVRVFRLACSEGHINIAKWLCEKFSITKEDLNEYISFAFLDACITGHLETIKWLYENYNIIREKILHCNVFLSACAFGYIDIIQWLYETFKITKEEALTNDPHGLYTSIFLPRRDQVIKWFWETYKVKLEQY